MDSNYLPLIAIAALITFGTRVAGFALGDRAIPAVARRFLAYVPVAAFAALVAPGLGRSDDDLIPRLAAAAVAAFVVFRFHRLWACICMGMVVYWLTRWVM